MGWTNIITMITTDLEDALILWDATATTPLLKDKLEEVFKNEIANNHRFSIEDIYYIVEIQKHACGLGFIPTSDAYQRFGSNLTLTEVILDEEDRQRILHSTMTKNTHYGFIKGMTTDDLSDKQKEYLMKIGINTSNIYQVETV